MTTTNKTRNTLEDFSKKHSKSRVTFLLTLEKHLAKENYSKELFLKVNEECGFSENYYLLLFPGGEQEIAKAVEAHHDDLMLIEAQRHPDTKKIREIIGNAVFYRIVGVASKELALRQSSYFLMPMNNLAGVECAGRTCNLIWQIAGDESTDFNYYTKRGLLLPVYLLSKAFYFSDSSKDFAATKKFIQDALDNIVNIASLKNKLSKKLSKDFKMPQPEDIPILRMFFN